MQTLREDSVLPLKASVEIHEHPPCYLGSGSVFVHPHPEAMTTGISLCRLGLFFLKVREAKVRLQRNVFTLFNVKGHIFSPICPVLSHFSCVRLFVTPWTVAHQIPLSIGLCKQEYWSGLSFPSPGDLPEPGIEPSSPALAGGFFTTSTIWEAPYLS